MCILGIKTQEWFQYNCIIFMWLSKNSKLSFHIKKNWKSDMAFYQEVLARYVFIYGEKSLLTYIHTPLSDLLEGLSQS
jgi:hypothetical protein